MPSSMQGITFGKPEPFDIPDWDYAPVKAIINATDLSNFYENLLDDAFDRDVEDFTYGLSPKIIQRLHEAAKTFEWQPWAEKIKKMGDHYKLKVSGIQDQGDISVHFIHRKSSKPDAINLLLVHGWPGSIIEFEQICHILTDRYNIVMPSIPGFTFSGPPKKPAKTKGGVPWNFTKTAQVFNSIMLSLGYDKYVTQGGDWGSMLTRHTAQCFPENVKALHLNFFSGITSKPTGTGQLSEDEQRGVERLEGFKRKGIAYQEMQGTVPYTLGGALACSPLALIIYIGEKFYRWSAPDTHPSPEAVIANCMLYYFTGSITSSFWLYYMRRSGDGSQHDLLEEMQIEQPVGFGCGPYEIAWPVKKAFQIQIPNLRQWSLLEKGGHFLALEAPQTLAADMDKLFQTDEVRTALGLQTLNSKL